MIDWFVVRSSFYLTGVAGSCSLVAFDMKSWRNLGKSGDGVVISDSPEKGFRNLASF